MGFVDDGGDERGLDRAVDLDLHVAEALVIVDGGAGFGFGGDQNFGRAVIRRRAVDDSGEHDAGADFFSVVDALAAGEQRVGIVGQIADGGDSGGEIEQAVVIADVGVHVPEAGEQGFAGGVDDPASAGETLFRRHIELDQDGSDSGQCDCPRRRLCLVREESCRTWSRKRWRGSNTNSVWGGERALAARSAARDSLTLFWAASKVGAGGFPAFGNDGAPVVTVAKNLSLLKNLLSGSLVR